MSEDIAELRRDIEEMRRQIQQHGEDISRLERQLTWDKSCDRARKNYGDGQNP
jgi:chromosome segregation ATPase